MARRRSGSRLEQLVGGASAMRESFQPHLDKALLTLAANGGLIYGAAELINRNDLSDPSKAVILYGTGAAAAAGNYLAFGSKGRAMRAIRRWANNANDYLDRYTPSAWAKTLGLGVATGVAAFSMQPYATQIYEDVMKNINPTKRAEKAREEVAIESAPIAATRNRPAVFDNIGYNSKVEHNFTGVRLMDKNSTIGRVQRTMRWKPIYNEIERLYGLPANTLGAMAMQESYGDPVQPNATDDGGLGLTHIQGNYAPQWGLKVHGSSRTFTDNVHGKSIREMLSNCKYDPKCVQEYDERAHIIKVLDAAARIVATGARRNESDVDQGIMFYRGGNFRTRRNYLNDVKEWRDALNDTQTIEKARQDFNKRNPGRDFDRYINQWHQMSNNWGLPEYSAYMKRRSSTTRSGDAPGSPSGN